MQVLKWQPGDNRSLSVPDGVALEVFDSWEGSHPARRASPCCAAKGQAAAPPKQSQIVSAENLHIAGAERQVQVLGASFAPRQPPPSDGPGENSSAPAVAEAPAVALAPADTEAPTGGEAAAPGLAAEPAADLVVPAAAVHESQVSSAEAGSGSSGAYAAPANGALEGGGLSASAGERTVETPQSEAPRCAVHAMPCCSTNPAQMVIWL